MGEITMMNQLTLRQKLILAAIPILLMLTLILGILGASRFKVLSSDPKPGSKINVYNVLVVNYNKNVATDHAQISSKPAFSYTVKANGSKLVISPTSPLQNKVTYTVQINNICEKGKASACARYTLIFTTDNTIPLSAQSSEQQQQVLAPVDAQYKTVPILSILPVAETDFYIDAKPSGSFTYVVITPNVDATTLSDTEYKALYDKFYQEGRAYLSAKKYSLETSNYKVVSDQEFSALTSGD
jgi:hypothetical protein